MLEWIRFIGEAIAGLFTGVADLLGLLVDAFAILRPGFLFAPSFLQPILYLTFAVAVLLWVVNIL